MLIGGSPVRDYVIAYIDPTAYLILGGVALLAGFALGILAAKAWGFLRRDD